MIDVDGQAFIKELLNDEMPGLSLVILVEILGVFVNPTSSDVLFDFCRMLSIKWIAF